VPADDEVRALPLAATGSIASITSSTVNSSSLSTSTTTRGAPSSWVSNPRSATWRNGITNNRSAIRPLHGGPPSSGTSRNESTTRRLPPSSPTVSRVPARVERRMIAHASRFVNAATAFRAAEDSVTIA